MEKSVQFVLFFALFLAAQVNCSASTFSSFPNTTQIDDTLFDASQLIIDESRLLDRSDQTGQKGQDKIESLPGQPKVKFNQYGGYITVNSTTGRALYYYLAEARDYRQDTWPLLIWFMGCSSLGVGAMEEMGPFRVYSDAKTLYENDYAWNQVANVLFLESPAGVGFSYSNTTTDYVIGERQLAIDHYVFLVNWLSRFPEYKRRSIYLGGRGSGGHYVTELAQTILNQNKRAKTSIINLKAITIGNGHLSDDIEDIAKFEYWGSHALISDDSTAEILKYCYAIPSGPKQSDLCDEILDINQKNFDAIVLQNIYADVCPSWSTPTETPKKASIFEYDPCSYMYVTAYLNRPDVKRALHADGAKIPWTLCSNVIKWTDTPSTILPNIKDLMNHGLPVWICSGDLDAQTTVTSVQQAIKGMKLSIQDPWRPWYSTTCGKDREVGGFTQVYKGNLTFATVRGAGRQIPSYQPGSALTLISNFLSGKKLPV